MINSRDFAQQLLYGKLLKKIFFFLIHVSITSKFFLSFTCCAVKLFCSSFWTVFWELNKQKKTLLIFCDNYLCIRIILTWSLIALKLRPFLGTNFKNFETTIMRNLATFLVKKTKGSDKKIEQRLDSNVIMIVSVLIPLPVKLRAVKFSDRVINVVQQKIKECCKIGCTNHFGYHAILKWQDFPRTNAGWFLRED